MIRLIARKLLIILIILPILHAVGYQYATVHPGLFAPTFGRGEPAPILPYGDYVRGLLAGDLGSIGQVEVAEIIVEPLQHSLILVGIALLVTIILGLLLGMLSISPRTRRLSPLALVILSAGSSMPGFLLGGMILSFLVYRTLYAGAGATPVPLSGYGLDEHLILPVLVLSSQPALYVAKIIASLLENELQQPYIRVAQSKGFNWIQLLWRHAWPGMMANILLALGEALRLMVGALVIVEAIFIWPGIGRIFLFTIGLRLDARPPGALFGNPPLLATIAVILGGWLLLADLLVAVLSYWVDPRLRRASEQNTAVARG